MRPDCRVLGLSHRPTNAAWCSVADTDALPTRLPAAIDKPLTRALRARATCSTQFVEVEDEFVEID